MKKTFDFDTIIIGSGIAGASAALSVARLAGIDKLLKTDKAFKSSPKIALVEKGKWGGSSLNASDVPRHALLNFSHLLSEARAGARFGLSTGSLRYNFPTALNWRTLAVRRSGANSKKPFESANLLCVPGSASFLSPYEIAVGDKVLAAKKFIIATGGKPDFGEISGLAETSCLTPDAAWNLSRPPKSVFVVGAGSTGCELASFFAELGSTVVLGESKGSLLPREDEEIGKILGSYFERELGIKLLTQSTVVAVEPVENGLKKVLFKRGGREKSVTVEAVVLATGSRPEVESLSLDNAGVKYTRSGISVDSLLRTSMKHIFAVGDCTDAAESSAERAAYEGALAAANLFSRQKNLKNYDGFVRLTETFPAVASAGLTENDCIKQGIKVKKAVLPLSAVSAANTSDFRYGLVKLLADEKGKLLGGTLVCPGADLAIGEIAVAVRHKFSATQLASTPHVSSSWSELVHLAARILAT
ncbi:NAD(P)/FAD-dependent oxidoreductase [Candidatus Saccharibacteria bacterium]|nr:NAD(P)/FAD-dependent oxidoreductase [Candidatus Saccharibacteria bacterium]